VGSRRKGRAVTIQILYQLEMHETAVDQALEIFWENHQYPEAVQEFADSLVRGVFEHKEKIDEIIMARAKNWAFSRITPIDRNILRAAVYELLFRSDIPYKVTLNEAIELGKTFGSEKSGSFINGILDNVINTNADLKKKDS